MITLLTILIGALFVFTIWKRMHQKNAELVFRHTIFQIRDELRTHCIQKNIEKDSDIFKYYDNNLCSIISDSYYITLFSIMFVYDRAEKNDQESIEFVKKMQSRIAEIPFLAELHQRRTKAIIKYIKEQHYVSITIMMPILTLWAGASALKNRFRTAVTSSFFKPSNDLKLA